MDSADSASNFSEDCHSESNLSNVSGLTGYEEELNSVRQLINSSTSKNHHAKSKSSNLVIAYENRIKSLSTELQNALKQNEKYKNQLFSLEHGFGLNEHSKFKSLLDENVQLRKDLDLASECIKSMNFNEKTENDGSKLRELQNVNYYLYSQMTYWKNETLKSKSEFEVNAQANQKIRQQFEDLKIDFNAKATSNEELKKKIVEQHVEIQGLIQKNMKCSSDLTTALNDLEYVRKSEDWYKRQLHLSQEEKNKTLDELSCLKSLQITKAQQIEGLQLEIESYKGKYEEAALEILRGRNTLQKVIENSKRKPVAKVQDHNFDVKVITDYSEKQLYESTIDDLKQELVTLKNTLREQQEFFNHLNKQNSDLLARNVVMQKSLNEKEVLVDNLKNLLSKNDLKMSILSDNLKQCKDNMSDLLNEKNRLELSLNSANFEKNQTEIIVDGIREDFNKFLSRYHKLMADLHEKEKAILALQKEKQELFMNHNWQVCEIEEAKNRLEDYKHKYEQLIEENSKLKSQSSLKNASKIEVLEENSAIDTKNGISHDFLLNFEKIVSNLFVNDGRFKALYINDLKMGCNQNFADENERNLNLGIYILNYLYLLSCQYNKNDESACAVTLNSLTSKIGEILASIHHKTQINSAKKNPAKNHLKNYCRKLENRCKSLNLRTEKLYSLLSQVDIEDLTLKSNERVAIIEKLKEEIDFSKTKLKVVDLEQKERQKRYERVNRTLLRKIKEHMRGRMLAEKNCVYFKKMYENLHLEQNNIKLAILEKDQKLEVLKTQFENEVPIEAFKIEAPPELSNSTNENLDNDLALSCMQSSVQALSVILKNSEDKLKFLTVELDSSRRSIEKKDEEIRQLNLRIDDLNNAKAEYESRNDRIVNMYKNQLFELQQTLGNLTTEKTFIERLCKDLKFALQTTMSQNKIFKEQMLVYKQEKEYNSLPDLPVNFPSPNKVDDTYIAHLLQLSNSPKDLQSLTDLQSHINMLKAEVSQLQNQIVDKIHFKCKQ